MSKDETGKEHARESRKDFAALLDGFTPSAHIVSAEPEYRLAEPQAGELAYSASVWRSETDEAVSARAEASALLSELSSEELARMPATIISQLRIASLTGDLKGFDVSAFNGAREAAKEAIRVEQEHEWHARSEREERAAEMRKLLAEVHEIEEDMKTKLRKAYEQGKITKEEYDQSIAAIDKAQDLTAKNDPHAKDARNDVVKTLEPVVGKVEGLGDSVAKYRDQNRLIEKKEQEMAASALVQSADKIERVSLPGAGGVKSSQLPLDGLVHVKLADEVAVNTLPNKSVQTERVSVL